MNESSASILSSDLDGLREIFPVGQIFLVSDDNSIREAAAKYGLSGHLLENADQLPHGANVVLVLRDKEISRAMRKTFEPMRVLLVPINSFDPDIEASLYTLRLALCSDYGASCGWNRYWARNVATATGPLVFEGKKSASFPDTQTSLSCTFGSEIEANAWMTPALEVGQWVSVASYCEFSMTAPSSTDWCGRFTINGTMAATGVLVAKDARCEDIGETRIRNAQRIRAELVARAPITLRLEDGQMMSITAGGEDFTEAVREVTNPDYELHTLELGIGTNTSLLPQIDWTYNSQMNEGAGIVHLGVGEGITGAHMDFVVAEGGHRFESAA